jgi:hypothetical protein
MDLQRYYQEHGEYPHETMAREQDVLARAEQRAHEKRAAERAEHQQAAQAQLLMEGRQPRTVAEVLAIARMMP